MRITQKMVIEYILPEIKKFKDNVNNALKGNIKFGEFKDSSGGVNWGGTKKEGKYYYAYCYGDLLFKHDYKSNMFEDCIQSSKVENEKAAKKKGWIIGKDKEFGDIPICPDCKEKIISILKEKHEIY